MVCVYFIFILACVASLYRDAQHVLYFAYGSNTNTDRFLHRVPSGKYVGKATLDDYKFKWYRRADIVPREDKKVEGVLWEIPRNELATLDTHEPRYERVTVTVETNRSVRAETYVMKKPDPRKPSKRYVKLIKEGYQENELPMHQIKKS